MDKGDLQAEEAEAGNDVDQLGPRRREVGQCLADILDLLRDVVHAGTAFREKPPNRRVLVGRREQLDPASADQHRCGFDSLIRKGLAVLERPAQEKGVALNGLVEIRDGNADMVDTERLHADDATSRRRRAAAA
jgi:hypothetical protein